MSGPGAAPETGGGAEFSIDNEEQAAAGGPPEPELVETIEHATYSTELVARPPSELVVADSGRAGPVRTTTGVVRVALSAVSEVASWSLGTAVGVTATVVRGSMAGHPPHRVLSQAGDHVRDSMRRALGVDDARDSAAGAPSAPSLRERGAELLRRSADVHGEDADHPAFARILSELAPDEARILRFLYLDGPQPALDIRTGRALSAGTQRIEVGMSLIGEAAALRYTDRAVTYLTNLRRLGLITVEGDQLDNPARYQLLESQPDVRRLLKRGFGTKVGYRSIALTSFGTEFTCACLPVPPLGHAL
ncbi:Abi-alpha family protein [Nocardia spumae]|uniref:Abi-alpha family protein n=1 Tax=Nocardia spumae TaxID=2887190 RepID=UPI001D13C9B4|nr:Abi-alpha family protein [Nocardia spumae]